MAAGKIYLVTSGSYSDYSVECAFTTRAKALEWINGSEKFDIEEFDLDRDPSTGCRQYMKLTVEMDNSAKLVSYEHVEDPDSRYLNPDEIYICERYRGDWDSATRRYTNSYIELAMLFKAGTPVQDALKVASKKCAQLKALHPTDSFIPTALFDRTTLARI